MDSEKDIFEELIKDKLTNYSLPVDGDSWDKIAKQLNRESRKKAQRIAIAVIAVAASIIVLFLLFPVNKKTYQHETANQLSNHEETIVQDVSEKEIAQQASPQSVKRQTFFERGRSGEQLAENRLAPDVTSTEETTEESPLTPAKEESNATENHPAASIHSSFDFDNETQTPVIKRKKQKSIRFSFGSGGNLLAENSTNSNSFDKGLNSDFTYFRAGTLAEFNTMTENILSYADYPDVNYHLPLSFGITVKKELNRTFAIESGVVYTFIETTFNRPEPQKSSADLRLHYIGIPLNIHTRIFKNLSPWEVYLSTGGMVEKGVLSHFVQKSFYSDNTMTTITSNEKISGLQWSVAISPGVDYQIYKNYSIYLEPKLSYYFDNNQPVSARTKHPVVIGINAGLRYSW